MSSPRSVGLAALMFLFCAGGPASAQDQSVAAPPGQSDRDPSDARPAVAPPGQSDRGRVPGDGRPVVVAPGGSPAVLLAPPGPKDADGESRSAAPADDKEAEDEIERARAAARAADPRLQGLERARAAARAADSSGGKDCLSAREARGAIRANRAVTLVKAMRAAREAWDGEVIDYKLCTYDGALAYELTLLNTDGRVARVRVEAANGKLVGVR
ncbi:PepSY domain-containing protein [Hansschlegelia zhihuaiae]|uniref:PepSY domain-containing protein n=1 Tax=Hansschlegelia zhihuaiae TaxID=405005 RepID=A0A4Q0MQE0_9HYPH|nr:hypothetical protein [Hansschlegelia zhihuaiae]RXF75439.1 hypothetical protein EK403_00855 [Hansschlegelia zhihuaiae]